LGRFRLFRYEIRCWEEGTIADVADAVTTETVTTESEIALRLVGLVGAVPAFVWGLRVAGSEEMWNSNSVISYLLALAGLPADSYEPPLGGRAPGWRTGTVLARLPNPLELDQRTKSVAKEK
jgi:hypothetical protein